MQFKFALTVRCPVCKRGPTHWCRGQDGKCIAPHRERAREALRLTCAVFGGSTSTGKRAGEGRLGGSPRLWRS